ncbi:MAG: F0F1 ATP synthase subunit A [Candidatus Gracilibacteria bacterium]|nr:F0F1 ATP synthase subunit A [Candidatus Gracilibacteria bacterium]
MHVSLTAEKLFDLGPLPVTNSLMTTWLVILLITLFAIVFRLRLKKNPKGAQNVVEAMMEAFRGAIDGVTNSEKQTRKFFPVIVTIFLFVLLNNWAGLIPGVGSIGIFHNSTATHEAAAEVATPTSATLLPKVEASDLPVTTSEATTTTEVKENDAQENTEADAVITHEAQAGTEVAEASEAGKHAVPFTPIFRPGTADLSFTLALAFCAVLLTQIMGVMSLGGWGYFSRFLNFHNPIHFFVGLLEIVSEFSKMVSFSFRLFGNIFAGEVLLTVIISLVPYVVPMPFYALEIFVGAVQALVFAALTLVFFKGAATEAH